MLSAHRRLWAILAIALLLSCSVEAQDFKKWEAKIREYQEWLSLLKSDRYRFWIKLDSDHRPHRLYVGEGFHQADLSLKKQFVEIFSHYLAGHPEKSVLIDLFDAVSGKQIGEFGWGGFRLYY